MEHKYKYILLLENGDSYFANSLWGLFTEIIKHRCFHLYKQGRWVY